jgi:hypothetical protein
MRMGPYMLTLGGLLFGLVGAFQCLLTLPTDVAGALIGCALFGVVGGGLYLLGRRLDRKLGPPDPAPVYSPKTVDTDFVVQLLTRERRLALFVGIGLLAVDALTLLLSTFRDEQGPVAYQRTLAAILAGLELLFWYGAAACFNRVLKLWNIEKTEIYRILTATPEQITGLTRHIFRPHVDIGTPRRGNMLELNVGDKKFKLSVSPQQVVSLKHYVAMHSPRAWYREKEHVLHV